MAKKYEKRESSGREYVDDTKAFVDYTMFSVAKLPRRWEHILINPMIDITDKIETIVYEANRIYIDPNKQPPAELYAAYTSRISCLSEALRCFSAFDRKIDRMAGMMDVYKSEKARLKSLLINEARKFMADHLDITVRVECNDSTMSYISYGGKQTFKMGISQDTLSHWMKLQAKAENEISDRLTKDRMLLGQINISGSVPA